MKKLIDWITNHPIYLFIMQDNRPLPTIKNWRGEKRSLSREIYVYTPDKDSDPKYEVHTEYVGKKVRLISGIDQSEVPGYHPTEGWVAVCPVDIDVAVTLGVKATEITLVE